MLCRAGFGIPNGRAGDILVVDRLLSCVRLSFAAVFGLCRASLVVPAGTKFQGSSYHIQPRLKISGT